MGSFSQKERDLLIEVATNVKNMCKKQDTIKSDLDRHIEKDDTFVTKGIWMWVTAGLASLFMFLIAGAYTYTYNVDRDLDDHKSNMIRHHITEVK